MYKSNRIPFRMMQMQLVRGVSGPSSVPLFECKMHLPFVPLRPCTRFTILSQFNDDVRLSLFKLRKWSSAFESFHFMLWVLVCSVLSALVVQVLMQFADLDRIKFPNRYPVRFIDFDCVTPNDIAPTGQMDKCFGVRTWKLRANYNFGSDFSSSLPTFVFSVN